MERDQIKHMESVFFLFFFVRLTHFFVANLKVLKGMDLGLFHLFVCVCFYFVCMLYMLGIIATPFLL